MIFEIYPDAEYCRALFGRKIEKNAPMVAGLCSAQKFVNYSVGCSASFKPRQALLKAMKEVLQGIQFYQDYALKLTLPGGAEAVTVLKDNTRDKWRWFRFLEAQPDTDIGAFLRQQAGDYESFRNCLAEEDIQVLLYAAVSSLGRVPVHFCKAVSPDMMISYWNAERRNIDNAFYHAHGVTQDNAVSEIPFF